MRIAERGRPYSDRVCCMHIQKYRKIRVANFWRNEDHRRLVCHATTRWLETVKSHLFHQIVGFGSMWTKYNTTGVLVYNQELIEAEIGSQYSEGCNT
jgi:hypothetical protein